MKEEIIKLIREHGRVFNSRKAYRELRKTTPTLPSVSSIEKHFGGFAAFQKELDTYHIPTLNDDEESSETIKKWREQVFIRRAELFGQKKKPINSLLSLMALR